MKKNTVYFYLLSLVPLFSQYALANETPVLNQVSFSASVSREVDNDLFKARLSILKQTEDDRLESMYDKVNKLAAKAFRITKKYKTVEATTSTNSTNPVYNRGKIEAWRIIYTIELKTNKTKDLADLVAELQSFMKLDNMSFMVSDEKREETENELITKAITDFNKRAGIITSAHNMKLYSLVKMNINSGYSPVQRYAIARESLMSASSATQPPVEAGTQKITISVTGTIQLKK